MARVFETGWRREPRRYAAFIALDFKNGVIRKCSCDPRKLASYFVTSPLPFETTPAFFRPEVLLRYKADPDKYLLSEHSITCRNAWSLETYGINDAGQVHSYLIYLSRLPYSEQVYWQSFNERPRAPLAEATYRRDFLGEFVSDNNPLHELKRELRELGDVAPALWKCKDQRLFTRVHLPVTSGEAEWSGEIFELAKLMNEGFETGYLRTKAVEAGIAGTEKLQAIGLIERLLRKAGWQEDAIEPIVEPLKEVQLLRSKLKGHASGASTRRIVADILRRHESYGNHFKSLAKASAASVRRVRECALGGQL
jgi:hypothetical protein